MEHLHRYRTHIYAFVAGLAVATLGIAIFCYYYSPINADAGVPTTYYVDSTAGNDTNNGTSPATAWKTTDKVNTAALNPGDSVLFKRGDIFFGTLTLTASGTASSPITIGAYGQGSNPSIKGFTTLTNWKDDGGGIWESPCPQCGSAVNMVTVNDKEQPMGRYPNADAANGGYLSIESHTGTSSITDSHLAGTPDWTGAVVVIRKNHWIIDRSPITADAGTTLTYTSASGYAPYDKFGYFIQNSPKTLDEQGEWYYNPATKTLQMFFNGDPSSYTVKVSALDTLVTANNVSNIVLTDLQLNGANTTAVTATNSQNITIENSTISYSGINAIVTINNNGVTILNNVINYTNNNAIKCSSICTISNNTISNTGTLPGMGNSGDGTYMGILVSGANNTITNNTLTNIGYTGIDFNGNNTLIKNNVINHFNMTKDDGGGIYTWDNSANPPVNYNRQIISNIIMNGGGAGPGTSPAVKNSAGIYMDDNSGNVEIAGNTVTGNNGSGIYLNNDHDISVHNNTTFNNQNELLVIHDSTVNSLVKNIAVTNNIFASTSAAAPLINVHSLADETLNLFGSFNNNAYFHLPTANFLNTRLSPQPDTADTFSNWRSSYNFDTNSQEITDTPLFEYNASGSSETIPLTGSYQDGFGTVSTNSITLAPYSSTVLSPVTVVTTGPSSGSGSGSGSDSGSGNNNSDSGTSSGDTSGTPTVVAPVVSDVVSAPSTVTPEPVPPRVASGFWSFIPLISTGPKAPAVVTPAFPSITTPTDSTQKKSYTIVSVEYRLNGVLVHTANTYPDGWTLDTTTMQDGAYTLDTVLHYADGTTDTGTGSFVVDNTPSLISRVFQWIKSLP